MKWAIVVVVIAAFLFAANFVFIPSPAPKAPAPRSAPLPATVTLEGRVFAADGGKPVAGAAFDCDASRFSGQSGPDGTYRLEGIAPGRRILGVEKEGYFRLQFPVDFATGGKAKQDLVLLRGGEIVLETADAAGEYATWDSLSFLQKNSQEPTCVQVIREMFEVPVGSLSMSDLHRTLRLAAGSYRARLDAAGSEPVELRFVVKEGETTTVKATLKRIP